MNTLYILFAQFEGNNLVICDCHFSGTARHNATI